MSQGHSCKDTGAVVPTLEEWHAGPRYLFIVAAFGLRVSEASVADI